MDSHRIKNVLGELTFGEYWNITGCNAYAVKSKRKGTGAPLTSTSFGPERWLRHGGQPEPCICFDFGIYGNLFVPLKAKAKVVGHKVVTHDVHGEEITLDFYELTPATGSFGP